MVAPGKYMVARNGTTTRVILKFTVPVKHKHLIFTWSVLKSFYRKIAENTGILWGVPLRSPPSFCEKFKDRPGKII